MRRAASCMLVATGLMAQPFGRPPALRNVGIEQHLNAQVPLDLRFRDESGASVRIGQLLDGKPVILSLVYYRCPMLCNMVLNGQTHAMRNSGLELGKEYRAITVSFDPAEGPQLAASKKASYIERFPGDAHAADSWRFLTGDAESIRKLADTVGFRFNWDEATQQWTHASGIMILTPDGRVSRYLYGIEYPKRDLRLALAEASQGKFASTADRILLFCYHYDPTRGRYGLAILNTLKAAGTMTAVGLALFIGLSLRKEARA